MTQSPQSSRQKNRQARPFGNGSLRFHPIAGGQVRQLGDLRAQKQTKKGFVLNGDVIRIGDPDRLGGDLAGDHHVAAFVGRNAIPAGARTGLFQCDARRWGNLTLERSLGWNRGFVRNRGTALNRGSDLG